MPELPAIEVKNLSKRYQLGTIGATTLRDSLVRLARRVGKGRADTTLPEEFWALRDVSFSVARGEVLGIIGKNGAGKSTLLKVLSRITDPTAGEAIIRGRVASLLEVGTGFHPELTGRENTYLNGAILGMRKREIDAKLEAISEFAGVEKFMDTPVKRYSSGMWVRLAFAVAAHLDPDILIIDEVLAVGDAAFQQKCLGKIGEVAESGRTVLFVSHNMAAIQSFCSRVLVIEDGTVAFDGSPSDGVERYYSGLTELRTTGSVPRTHPIPDTAAAWVTSARLITKRDSEQPELNTGDPLSFEVAVTARTPLPGLVVGIGIENVRGVRICTFHTKCDPQFEVEGSAGDYLFRCDVGEVGLAGGVYHVRIQIETGNESVELIESAFTFLLLSTDYFQNGGRLVGGAILVPQRWSLQRPADRRLAEDDVHACSLSS